MDIYKIAKYVHLPKRNLEWFWYSFYYLLASKKLTEQVKEQESKGDSSDETKNHLLVPLLFNLRHGIELLLKWLVLGSSIDLPRTHDISKLFDRVKELFNTLDASELKKASESVVSLGLEEDLTPQYIAASIWRLEQIARKYYGYAFLTDGTAMIEDKQNELFRYPVSINKGYTLDPDGLHSKISVAELLLDLDFLINFMFTTLIIFGRMSDGRMLTEVDE